MVTKKKIVFIMPPISVTELFGDMGDVGNILPPIGLLLLASLTRKYGYDTYFIDSLALKLNKEEIVRRVLHIEPDYVGLTATTLTVPKAALIAQLIKEKIPQCKIIIGGPHVSAVPERTLEKYPEIDIGVVGEGEDTLIDLLAFLDAGSQGFQNVKGIVYRNKEGKSIRTALRPLIEDFDSYPLPAWDLLPDIKSHYRPSPENLKRLPAVSLVITRGCPLGCTFCFNRSDSRNRMVRWYSIDKIVIMIEEMVNRYGIKEISFLDDNMIANKKKMTELCQRLIERKIDLTWSCLGSTNFADEGLFRLMKRAGCWQISWGIEHARQEILDVYCKNIKVSLIRENFNKAKRAGLRNRAFIMHGNFLETKDSIEDNIRYLLTLPVYDFHANYFMPLPGTIAYQQVEKYGRWLIDPEKWENYASYSNPIFLPHGLTTEEIVESYNRMYRGFYLRPKIFTYFIKKMLSNPSTIKPLIKTAIRFLEVFR